VCLVGEEQYGLERVMEVEDERGWNRFWGRDKNFFRRQGARGRIEPNDGSRFALNLHFYFFEAGFSSRS
jgi:hypothetical protein